MSHLKVPYFKQEAGLSCGLACMRMVLGYYGDKVSEKELSKHIKIHSYGTFTTDLGALALERGYKVTVFTFHLRLLGPLEIPFGTKVTDKLLSSAKVTAKDKTTYESWKKYLRADGKLIWDVPKITEIENWMNKNVPCVININTAATNHFWKNWDNGHQLVVDGVGKNNILVLDPDPYDKTEYSIEDGIFLPAWSINAKLSSGFLMAIEK